MTQKSIRYWTAGIAVASGILAIGDKAIPFTGIPGWVTSCWPFVLMAAGIFKEVAVIMTAPVAPTPLQGSGPVNPAPVANPPPTPFRQPLGQPQKPSA